MAPQDSAASGPKDDGAAQDGAAMDVSAHWQEDALTENGAAEDGAAQDGVVMDGSARSQEGASSSTNETFTEKQSRGCAHAVPSCAPWLMRLDAEHRKAGII